MNILGIDTSFLSYTSVGFKFDSGEELELVMKAPMSQEEKLLSTINSGLTVLGKTIRDIDAIACGVGPGSFTGIRIGLSTARGLAWSLKKKMIGLSSLELLVLSLPPAVISPDTLVVPLIDARMNRVFASLFKAGSRLTEDSDLEPQELLTLLRQHPGNDIIFIGDGYSRHAPTFAKIKDRNVTSIQDFAVSGLAICREALQRHQIDPSLLKDPKDILPVYLRKSEAEVQLELKSR